MVKLGEKMNFIGKTLYYKKSKLFNSSLIAIAISVIIYSMIEEISKLMLLFPLVILYIFYSLSNRVKVLDKGLKLWGVYFVSWNKIKKMKITSTGECVLYLSMFPFLCLIGVTENHNDLLNFLKKQIPQ